MAVSQTIGPTLALSLYGSNNASIIQDPDSVGLTNKVGIRTEALVSRLDFNSAGHYNLGLASIVVANYSVFPLRIPHAISFSRVDFPMSISLATTDAANSSVTHGINMSAVLVIYTRNASTLNPIVGMSSTSTYTWSADVGAQTLFTGNRMMSFNLATSLPASAYYMGMNMSFQTTGQNSSATISCIIGSTVTDQDWADMSAATATSINLFPFLGVLNTAVTNTTQSLQLSQFHCNGKTGGHANYPVVLRNS